MCANLKLRLDVVVETDSTFLLLLVFNFQNLRFWFVWLYDVFVNFSFQCIRNL